MSRRPTEAAAGARVDHLVVMAATLEQGVAWCEAVVGVTPGPGGAHAAYGTHNRLLAIGTPAHPLAYLEIIAIDPAAVRPPDAPARRWFDMDDAALQAAVARDGPQLTHWVAGTADIAAARSALAALGIDRGPVHARSRVSAQGTLHWRITVRDDGARLFDGVLPSLIQWGGEGDHDPPRLHPGRHLPDSGCALQRLSVSHPQAALLGRAHAALGLKGVAVQAGPPALHARLLTPRGPLDLASACGPGAQSALHSRSPA